MPVIYSAPDSSILDEKRYCGLINGIITGLSMI
jgi:hypothetical protein